MLQVILKLIDFDAKFLFIKRLQIYLLVGQLEILVVLRIVLLEAGFVFFKVDRCLSELRAELFYIERLHTEVACHCKVVVRIDGGRGRSLRVKFHFDARQGIINVNLLITEPSHLFSGQVLELIEFVS